MRFHFGGFREEDEELRRKAAVIGWFNLISEMRASGVQPITVWDQRGTRPWKAAEARRRLLRRTEFIARLRHEEARAERLAQWQAAFDDFESLSEAEKDIIRGYWQKNVIQVNMPVKPKAGKPAKSLPSDETTSEPPPTVPGPISSDAAPTRTEIKSALPALVSPEEAEQVIERVSEYLSTLSTLVADYDAYNKPFQVRHKVETPEVVEAIDHVRELEEVVEGVPTPPADETELIDSVLEEVVPIDTFNESARQTELTREEGLLVNAFFLEGQAPSPPVEAVNIGDPRDRLEGLLETTPEIRKTYERALHSPSSKDHADCRELLLAMGVPVIEAQVPYEAEGLAAALWKAGYVDLIGTEDSDVLAYEGPLLRTLSGRSPLQLIDGTELRQSTGLSPSAFLDFCILLGTDASPRIPGIGPATAFKYITKYGSIDNLLDNEPKVKAKIHNLEEYIAMVRAAREVFGKLPEIPQGVLLEQGVWDEDAVERLLDEKHGVKLVGAFQAERDELRFEDIQEDQ
ncbi:PIN domain-like protein [Naematelia encephala]|uniref:Exonuclease 1 n=1 Tax=Naematelia encephala TaxID=71784 RepID=A0A1Y2ANI0_9TREE|nr:PIN domain-like protein [Naematelia encephala]